MEFPMPISFDLPNNAIAQRFSQQIFTGHSPTVYFTIWQRDDTVCKQTQSMYSWSLPFGGEAKGQVTPINYKWPDNCKCQMLSRRRLLAGGGEREKNFYHILKVMSLFLLSTSPLCFYFWIHVILSFFFLKVIPSSPLLR